MAKKQKKVRCPECGKKISTVQIKRHVGAKHPDITFSDALLEKKFPKVKPTKEEKDQAVRQRMHDNLVHTIVEQRNNAQERARNAEWVVDLVKELVNGPPAYVE